MYLLCGVEEWLYSLLALLMDFPRSVPGPALTRWHVVPQQYRSKGTWLWTVEWKAAVSSACASVISIAHVLALGAGPLIYREQENSA